MPVTQAANTERLTEAEIQDVLARDALTGGRVLAIPNCYSVFGWEADLLTVTRSWRVDEYEIKCRRPDWLAELRSMGGDGASEDKRQRWQALNSPGLARPNRFWIATAPGVASLDEIPDLAGWIEVRGNHHRVPVERKPAPKLHGEPIRAEQYQKIARGICLRFWKGAGRDLTHAL